MARVAEAWGVTPRMAARELDSDPEQLSLVCIPLLEYARAHHALHHGKGEEALAPWKGTVILKHLKRNASLKREIARARAAKGKA